MASAPAAGPDSSIFTGFSPANLGVEMPPEMVPNIQEQLVDLARRWVRTQGGRRLVVPVPLPGRTGRMMRTGALLPGAGARLGSETFAAWLDRTRPAPRRAT